MHISQISGMWKRNAKKKFMMSRRVLDNQNLRRKFKLVLGIKKIYLYITLWENSRSDRILKTLETCRNGPKVRD